MIDLTAIAGIAMMVVAQSVRVYEILSHEQVAVGWSYLGLAGFAVFMIAAVVGVHRRRP